MKKILFKKEFFLIACILLILSTCLSDNAHSTPIDLSDARLELTFDKHYDNVTIRTYSNNNWCEYGLSQKNWASYQNDGENKILIDQTFSTKLERFDWLWFFPIYLSVKDQKLDIEFTMDFLFGNALDGDTSGTGSMNSASKGMYTFDFEGHDGNKYGYWKNSLYTVEATNFTTTPEPNTMILFGFGLLFLAKIVRKKC